MALKGPVVVAMTAVVVVAGVVMGTEAPFIRDGAVTADDAYSRVPFVDMLLVGRDVCVFLSNAAHQLCM